MAGTRFPIRLDPVWRPLLLVGGATQGNSYLEIERDALIVHFGWLYGDTIPIENVESVEEGDWPIWMGVGWRVGFGSRFGLTGSFEGVVDVNFKEPVRVWRIATYKTMSVSLEDPKTFVAALSGLI
jgi:hypothetical protein